MDTITLDGREWRFVAPPLPIQMELMVAWNQNKPRVAAAAINLCLRDEGGAMPYSVAAYLACGCNPLVYGGPVMESLHNAGVPTATWYDIGLALMNAVALEYDPPTAADVEKAEVFTEPATDGGPLATPSP